VLCLNYCAVASKTVFAVLIISAVIIVFSVVGLMLSADADAYLSSVVDENITFPTVIIDPGHGGEDGGAEANGVTEKNINLAVSLMLSDYFSVSKYECVLTREDDRLLYSQGEEKNKKRHDLINRVKFANDIGNALFVSIHQNKFEQEKYSGTQVFYSPNNEKSFELATEIQKSVVNNLQKDNERQVKKGDKSIYLLKNATIPAVIVECGFLSNYEEARKLSEESYQKQLAEAIMTGILDFLKNND
jgi:N-acetylmuramoyl-L-alanine amidase